MKKQKIKETIIGIALAISIGIGGSLGSYAYFSDKINVDNGIKITMGTLDVGIGDGFNINDPKEDSIETKIFDIENKGTLDELLKIKMDIKSIVGQIEHDDLDDIEYTLKENKEGGKVLINGNFENLEEKWIDIGRLDAGKKRSYIATLKFDDDIDASYIEDIEIKFDLVVKGFQINDKTFIEGGAN